MLNEPWERSWGLFFVGRGKCRRALYVLARSERGRPEMNKKQTVLVVLATFAIYVALKTPFTSWLEARFDVISAWLCEQVMNGMGIAVKREDGVRLQTVNFAQPFRFIFRDGFWLVSQLYVLFPLSLALGFCFKRPVWKVFLVGMIVTFCGFCGRAMLLGFNAATFGQQAAAGWMDTGIRVGVPITVMLVMVLVVARGSKEG